MSPVLFAALYCLAVLVGSALSSPGPVLASGDQRVAVVPVPQTESWWTERHERALAHVRRATSICCSSGIPSLRDERIRGAALGRRIMGTGVL